VTRRTGIRAALMLLQPPLLIGLYRTEPSAFAASLEFAYVDRALTGWTPIAQPALLASGTALALQASRFIVCRNTIESGLVWAMMAVFIALQGTQYGWKPTNFFATAGLILTITLLEASYKATYVDETTGLPGRQAFDTALKELERHCSVAVIEIDQLKSYNNAHGLAASGQILRRVTAAIAGLSVRGQVYHLAGENFAVLFPGTSSGETLADLVLRRQDQVRKQRDHRTGTDSTSKELPITISIGVADQHDASIPPDVVIRTAYRALYRAKVEGGNLAQEAAPTPLRHVHRAVASGAEREHWTG
jgi:diguanylate cyclase (GGDEF)-like protein